MKSILLLAIVAFTFSCTFALDIKLNEHWKSWKETNNKHYSDVEEHVRYEIFFFISRLHLLLFYEIIVLLYGKVI